MSHRGGGTRTRRSGPSRLNDVFEVHRLIYEKKMRECLTLGLTTVTIRPGDRDIVDIRKTLPNELNFLTVIVVTGNGQKFGVRPNDIILRPIADVSGQESWRSMEEERLNEEAAKSFKSDTYILYVARRNPQVAPIEATHPLSLAGSTPDDDMAERECEATEDAAACEESVAAASQRAAIAVTPPSPTSRTRARESTDEARQSKQQRIGIIPPSFPSGGDSNQNGATSTKTHVVAAQGSQATASASTQATPAAVATVPPHFGAIPDSTVVAFVSPSQTSAASSATMAATSSTSTRRQELLQRLGSLRRHRQPHNPIALYRTIRAQN